MSSEWIIQASLLHLEAEGENWKRARGGGLGAARVASSYQFQHLVVAMVGRDLGTFCCLCMMGPILRGVAHVWVDRGMLLQDICLMPTEISGSF